MLILKPIKLKPIKLKPAASSIMECADWLSLSYRLIPEVESAFPNS